MDDVRQGLRRTLGRDPNMRELGQALEVLEDGPPQGAVGYRGPTGAAITPVTQEEVERNLVNLIRTISLGERGTVRMALEAVIDIGTRRENPIQQFMNGLLDLPQSTRWAFTNWYRSYGPFFAWGDVPDAVVDALTAVNEDTNGEISNLVAAEAYQAGREEGLRTLRQYATDFLAGVPQSQRARVAAQATEELTRRGFVVEAQELANSEGLFTHPTAPAEPEMVTGYPTIDNLLARLNENMTALGFPPESITVEHSLEGASSLTIHMPVTQLTQLTGPGHSSVIFTHRR